MKLSLVQLCWHTKSYKKHTEAEIKFRWSDVGTGDRTSFPEEPQKLSRISEGKKSWSAKIKCISYFPVAVTKCYKQGNNSSRKGLHRDYSPREPESMVDEQQCQQEELRSHISNCKLRAWDYVGLEEAFRNSDPVSSDTSTPTRRQLLILPKQF